jgi:hypothetical protein
MYLPECPFSLFEIFEILPLETLPLRRSEWGVVYLRIVLSPEEESHKVKQSHCE